MSTSNECESPPRSDVGHRGEALAAEYLREQGWTIRETNYETRRGEIDLVARTTESLGDREIDMLVFVEVKTRSNKGAVLPESAVTRDKRSTLTYMARHYLSDCELDQVSSRFDVVTVVLAPDPPEIEHYPSAFDASGRLR